MKNSMKLFGLLFLSITLFASCSKDDEEVKPDYVGTWVAEGLQMTEEMALLKSTDISDGDLTDVFGAGKITMVLTVNTFDVVISVPFFGVEMPLGGARGDFAVNGNKVKQTLKKVGVADIETGELTYYGPGTPEFESALDGGSDTIDGEYSVSGNKLTLKTDDNGDGVYEGDEIMIFTKK